MPLTKNKITEDKYIVPDTIQFRFKTEGIPTQTFYTQSLFVKKSNSDLSNNFDLGVKLIYTPFTTGSYLGAPTDGKDNWGDVILYMSSSTGYVESSPINLPFFDGDWWSVMLRRDQHVSSSVNNVITEYTLYTKNKLYRQNESNRIGFQGSSKITSLESNFLIDSSINEAWNRFGTSSLDGIYLGGFISGSNIGGVTINPQNILFSGSFQEFRYYSTPISEEVFDDFVMNPESIEGLTTSDPFSSFNTLNFRADLGNELDYTFPNLYLGNRSVRAIPPQIEKWIYRGDMPDNLNNNSAGYFRNAVGMGSNPYLYFHVLASGSEDSTCFHSTGDTYIESEKTANNYTYGHVYFYLTITEDNNPDNVYTYKVLQISCKETGSGACLSSSPSGNYLNNYGWDVEFLSSGSNSDPIGETLITGSVYTFKYELPVLPVYEFNDDGTEPIKQYKSIHPSVSTVAPQLTVSSFIDPNTQITSNNFNIIFYKRGNYLRKNIEDYFANEPIVGIKNRVNNKIQIIENSNYGKVLSNLVSIEQNPEEKRAYTEDIVNFEAVFSPQNEINDDITQTLGFNAVLNILGDPRQISNPEEKHYIEIRKLAEYYFQKYKKGNIYDYLRLVKFFDNSLFKSIKKYTPARTGISTGILIKQHFLERNRHIVYAPKIENITLEGRIAVIPDVLQVSGGAGGSVNKYNKI
jgi:hypothetical protein